MRVFIAGLLFVSVQAFAQGPKVPARHPQEVVGEGTFLRRSDLMQAKPILDMPKVMRVWRQEKTKDAGTLLVEVVGTVPTHFHPDGDHRIFVLEGELKFMVGTKETTIKPGDYVLIPRGVRHKLQLAKGTRALLGAVDTPPVDPQKTIWLEPMPVAEGRAPTRAGVK